ncbi:MAG: AP endonuclease [Geobacter sp.]|nr:MAG: AP endonuclease [Geobacter sp.]
MNDRLFVHVPYTFLAQNLELVLARKVNPEVFFSGDMLDCLIPEQLAAITSTLAEHSLSATIHAPFIDLNPGSAERLIREATRHRLNQVIDAAAILKPRVVVFHPGYDRWRYGENQETWLRHSIEAWEEILPRAAKIGFIVAVENIFEEEPSTLLALFEALPRLRHCFDVGHWNLFTKVGMEEWFATVGSFIAEAHIHDNHGQRDDHAPVGEGSIDFDLFFRLMEKYAPQAVWTIEAHSKEDLDRSLVNIGKFL